MKKLLVIAGLLLASATAHSAILSTNLTTGGVVHLLSANRANVYSIELSSDKAVTVDFFDADDLTAPYYGTNSVSAAYTYRTAYATNIVSSYVGQTGFTNWYTNSGLFTLTLTNAAATNALPKTVSAVVAANSYTILDVDALFVEGICVRPSTNVSIVINYRSGQ